MKRITKIGSIGVALVIALPLFLALDWFGGAEAAQDAPLLYAEPGPGVTHVAHAEAPLSSGTHVYAYTTDPDDAVDPGALVVRPREADALPLVAMRAAEDADPWHFSDVDIATDGTLIVGGTLEGLLIVITSDELLYDTVRQYDAKSPVTDLEVDPSGRFFTAVTYAGDLFLFQRDVFLATGGPSYHDTPRSAPAPTDEVTELLDPVVAYRDPIGADTEGFTLRPYSHVTFSGLPAGPGDPRGLAIVAGTAYGELFGYDLGAIPGGTDNVPYQPTVHHAGDAQCRQVPTAGGAVELPCSSAATARLIDRLDSATAGVAADITKAIGGKLRDTLRLDHLAGLTLGAAQNPLVALDGTLGAGNAGRHVVVAATRGGSVDVLGLVPGTGGEEWMVPLWTLTLPDPLDHAQLSRVAGPIANRVATLAVVSDRGLVTTYAVRPGDTVAPSASFSFDASHGAGGLKLTRFAMSRGDGPLGESAAGTYFAYTTETDRVALVDTRVRLGPDAPAMAWEGPLQLGAATAFDVTDSGSVVVGGQGLSLYAALVSVRIVSPDSVAKMAPFRAEALIDAPDSTVSEIAWRIEATKTGIPVAPVDATGPTLDHVFRVEGTYKVRLLVKDSNLLTVSADRIVSVGGAKPVLKYVAPSTSPIGTGVVFDFTGSHDPDAAVPGHGLTKIEFYPWGDGRSTLVDLSTMQVTWDYGESAGLYVTRAKAFDHDGRTATAERTLRITGAGYAVSSEPAESGPMRLKELAVAHDTGHMGLFGGNNGAYGRIQLRGPDTGLLYSLGTAQVSSLPSHVGAGAMTPDGSVFFGGHEDGSLVRMPVADPTNRVRIDLFDDPVGWVFVARDGKAVVAVSEAGEVASLDGALSRVTGRAQVGAAVLDAAADDRLVHLVLWTEDGSLLLLDGERAERGILDSTPAGEGPTAFGLTPNLDPQGRAWAFLGREDGRVETFKIQGNRFYSLGNATYHDGVAIHAFAVGSLDEKSEYRLVAASRGEKITCKPDTAQPCGRMFFIDSRGPRVDNRLVPARTVELPERPLDVAMTDDGRMTLVVVGESKHKMLRYDTLWSQGPVATLTDLPGRALALGMAQTGAGYLLVDTGQVVWAYAPPRAAMRIGPHDAGAPVWGARISAQNDVTFDASQTRPGDGSIIAYEWVINGETFRTPEVVTRFEKPGAHQVRLTVTTQTTSPTSAILIDRIDKSFAVWNPPPIGRLSATPFDAAQGAVVVDTGQLVRFDATASYDPLGQNIQTYKFVYGDGQEAMGGQAVRQRSYADDGIYWARVTAYDSDGFGGTSERIKVIVHNRAPTPVFKMEQPGRNETTGTVTLGVPVSFDSALSSDPDGSVTAWEWVFSDGRTAATKTVSHTFTNLGAHTVQLRVRDNDGAWSTPLVGDVLVDDGIRLRQTQDPPTGRQVNPTQQVKVFGFVHGFQNFPADGTPISGATVHIRVFFDGALGSDPATTPYHTATKTTDAAGNVEHEVPFNQAGVAYKPGRYRVTMTAAWSGSAHGDTEYSETKETVFVAEP